jgi:hypothetical protein
VLLEIIPQEGFDRARAAAGESDAALALVADMCALNALTDAKRAGSGHLCSSYVSLPGVEANSGSLGMGISKGRCIAWSRQHLGRDGRVVVMVGAGELQEGRTSSRWREAGSRPRWCVPVAEQAGRRKLSAAFGTLCVVASAGLTEPPRPDASRRCCARPRGRDAPRPDPEDYPRGIGGSV